MNSDYFSHDEQNLIAEMMSRGVSKTDAIQHIINTKAAFLHAKEKGDSEVCKLHGKRIKEMVRDVPYEERSLE